MFVSYVRESKAWLDGIRSFIHIRFSDSSISIRLPHWLDNHKMGRPCASEENKMAALAFASIITKQTMNHDDLLARCGRCSLFATLQQMYPHIIREADTGDRDGISEVEFNKLLQVRCGSATGAQTM